MEELKRLRFNANLKDLDLRLNPITRTEPDYRLYMIHMLPNLQKLGRLLSIEISLLPILNISSYTQTINVHSIPLNLGKRGLTVLVLYRLPYKP